MFSTFLLSFPPFSLSFSLSSFLSSFHPFSLSFFLTFFLSSSSFLFFISCYLSLFHFFPFQPHLTSSTTTVPADDNTSLILGVNNDGSPLSEVDPDTVSVTASIVTAIHVPPPDNGDADTPVSGPNGAGLALVGGAARVVEADSISQVSDLSFSGAAVVAGSLTGGAHEGGSGAPESSALDTGIGAGKEAPVCIVLPDDTPASRSPPTSDHAAPGSSSAEETPRTGASNTASMSAAASNTAASNVAASNTAPSASEAFSWEKTSPEGRTAQESLDKSKLRKLNEEKHK